MKTKLKWQVTVESTEPVEDLLEFGQESLRGLIASEMVPDTAKVVRTNTYFDGNAGIEVRWETENEMEYGDNYKVS